MPRSRRSWSICLRRWGGDERAVSGRRRLAQNAGKPADGVLAENLAQDGFGESKASDLPVALLQHIGGSEVVPFAVVGCLECVGRALFISRPEGEIGAVDD